jgi:hypothetical protein
VEDRRGRHASARLFTLDANGDLIQRASEIPFSAAGLVHLEEVMALHHSLTTDTRRIAARPPKKETPVMTTTDKLELAIAETRRSNPTFTHAQAYTAALTNQPELYVELSAVPSPGLAAPTRPAPANAEADRAIELAIADERTVNPMLTREQAYVEALRKRPDLYRQLMGLSAEDDAEPRRHGGGIHITG